MDEEFSSKQITMDELDDIELKMFFRRAAKELAKRESLDEHNFIIRVEHKLYRIECEITELNSADDFDDDDDWYDDDSNSRTPNDDRSDSMNPNSDRYNP
jgi:hypothetical protein